MKTRHITGFAENCTLNKGKDVRILFITGVACFFIGVILAYKIQNLRIDALKHELEISSATSGALVKAANLKYIQALRRQDDLSRDLEAARASSVATINELDRANSSLSNKLRTAISKVCRNTVPNSKDPGVLVEPPGKTDFPERLARFLRERAKIADLLADYAEKCHSFLRKNCGL